MIESIDAAMTAMEVVKMLVLAASPARVWKAITEPAELVKWFPDKQARIKPEAGAEGAWVWKQYGAYSVRFDVVEPRLLCNPVEKNGEDIQNPDDHLVCYKVEPVAGAPEQVPVGEAAS